MSMHLIFIVFIWFKQDRKFREFELFTNSNFKQGLSSQMENLPFGAFKLDWNLVERTRL